MEKTAKGNAIAVAAKDIISLEQQALELDRRAVKLKEEAEKSRVALFDLISDLQDAHPDQPLPGLFTAKGVLIDITGGKDYIELHRAPELNHLLELIPDTSG